MTAPVLFADLPETVPPQPAEPTRPEHARVVRPVRTQIEWAPRDLDAAVSEDHAARPIWALLERLDLSGFYESIKAVVDRPGRPATDPQVLLALWLYATADGVGSARRLARLCEEHDAYRWLRGGVPINYHLLADFRVANERVLNELLTKILAAMMAESLVSLKRVAQDGMRVRASAGGSSFRGAASLQECLRQGPGSGGAPGAGAGASRPAGEPAGARGAGTGGRRARAAGAAGAGPVATGGGSQSPGARERQEAAGERAAGIHHRSRGAGDAHGRWGLSPGLQRAVGHGYRKRGDRWGGRDQSGRGPGRGSANGKSGGGAHNLLRWMALSG